ncbi:hypothetical protein RND81_01G048000 [Saponaria officinalis]|uniref:rRNA N-glycosylase n=1 Tax=Saponaria officinalis TaxID=3572 RepID=A0AAW1NCR9_SAPOF
MNNNKTTYIYLLLILAYFTQVCVSIPNLSLDLNTPPSKSAYNKVINDVQNFVKGKPEYDGIPMMSAPSTPFTYIIITLLAKRGATNVSFSVAINKNNLYIVGYADESTRKAFFFDDSKDAEASIFPGRVQLMKVILKIRGGYGDLEKVSDLKRANMKLTLDNVKSSLLSIQGKAGDESGFDKDQASFLMYAIQAFSEGARFKYVQNKFNGNVPGSQPDYKVSSLENSWQPISKGVKIATKRKLLTPLVLACPNGSRWQVVTIDEIKPDIGMLLYVI